jgi:hypothetical protein
MQIKLQNLLIEGEGAEDFPGPPVAEGWEDLAVGADEWLAVRAESVQLGSVHFSQGQPGQASSTSAPQNEVVLGIVKPTSASPPL